MKAIYINLDPYLAAFAAWIKGGKVGDPPKFDPLPLAVTIPVGGSAAIAIAHNDGNETNPVVVPVGSDSCSIDIVPEFSGDAIATGVQLGLSAYTSASYPALYDIYPVSGDSVSVNIPLSDEDGETITVPFTVLVRRETASGPVDLVDFTPPAAAPTAAQINTALGGTGAAEGQPLKGVSLSNATNAPAPTADAINKALGGPGVLSDEANDKPLYGVSLGGAILKISGDDAEPTYMTGVSGPSDSPSSFDAIGMGVSNLAFAIGNTAAT